MPIRRHALICHAASPCPKTLEISVSTVFLQDKTLQLHFAMRGDLAAIRFPAPQAAGAADHLWQRTCCEAFIGAKGETAYREFNFSPSSQWAAYQFNDYRLRDEHFQPSATPQVTCLLDESRCELVALLPPMFLPDNTELQLGLSAVIEFKNDHKTYWALNHPAPQPDFHLRPSFALTLNKP